MLQWVPNILTGLRIALLPVLLYLLVRMPAGAPPGSGERRWAALILLAIGATDYLDGVAARRLDAVSRLGSAADAVADRLVLALPLLYLALADHPAYPPVGLWIPLWLIGLDVVTSTAWAHARWRRGEKVPSSHNLPGRVATWVYFALLLWVVMGLPEAGVPALAVGALGLSTVSSAMYVRRWWRAA